MAFFGYTLAALTLAAILAFLWLLAPARPSRAMRAGLRGQKYAHRGIYDNAGSAPENSMPAFAAAADKGYGIELDIRLTRDGRVVVFHDGSLERVCGLKKPVDALSLAELKELKLLGTEERIPEFGEFLALMAGRVPLLVEFKTGLPGSSVDTASALCMAAMALLDAYSGPYVIESFDYLVLEWFRRHRPAVMRGQLGMGFQCYVPAIGKAAAEAIPLYRRKMLSWLLYNHRSRPHFISYRFQDARFGVSMCRALGAMVSVWTVKTAAEAAELMPRYDAIIFEGFLP